MTKRILLAAIFALFFGTAAQAQIIGDVDVKAAVPGLKANVSATTTVDDDEDTDSAAGTSTGVGEIVRATTGASVNSDGSTVITRSDIKEEDDAFYDPADITTSTELSAYARSIMSADENIVKVEYAADEVSIWYKEPAEFLGIIPMTLTTKATVDADGEIEIDRPWYRAFVTVEEEDALESSLESTAGTIARSEGSTELSSNAQARLLNALRASMKMYYDSTINTGTSTDESVDY